MSQSQYLSEKERIKGSRNMQTFELFNGISYGLLGETLVYILAVRFSASNIFLGLIPSAIYLTALIIPFVIRFMVNRNLCRSMYVMWLLRGFVGIGYLGLLFTEGQLRVSILLTVYLLYAVFRAIGIISYDPIAKSVTTLYNRGSYYAALNFSYNFTLLFAKLLASLVTTFMDSLLVIVILQMVGVVGNTFASHYAGKIPCRINFSYSKDESYFGIFKKIVRNGKLRDRVFLKWINMAVSIMMGMTIPFMSVKLKLSDGLVIMYSVVVSVAYLTAGFISRRLSDKVGAKPLLQIASVVSIIFTALFSAAPLNIGFLAFFILGYVVNVAIQVCVLQSGSLVVGVMPDRGAGSFNVVVNIGTGIIATVAGFLSGYLVNIGEELNLSGATVIFNDYSLCFVCGLVFSLFGLVYTISLREKGAKKATQLMSIRNLQAVSQLSALEKDRDNFYRRRHIMYLGENSSNFLYNEIHQKLLSPYSRELKDLLQVIGDRKRTEYVDDVINIAGNDSNYMQVTAIETLSNFSSISRAKECLEYAFRNSRWISARTAAAKALSNFSGTEAYYNEVVQLSEKAEHIEVCVDCIIAEYYMDKEKRLFADIFAERSFSHSEEFRQTRYSCYDALLLNENALSRLARIYERLNNSKDAQVAVRPFLEDNRNIAEIDENFDSIMKSVMSSDAAGISSVSMRMIKGINSQKPEIRKLAEGIGRFPVSAKVSCSDIIALLYFSVLAKNSADE